MRIDTHSVPFSLCCLWEDARCGRDLCQVSCGNPCSGWPCWMLLCRSRKPYAAAPASTRSPCTPQRGLSLQLPTSCACGDPRCAGTWWPVCGLSSGWEIRVFGKGRNWGIMIWALLVGFTLIEDSLTKNGWECERLNLLSVLVSLRLGRVPTFSVWGLRPVSGAILWLRLCVPWSAVPELSERPCWEVLPTMRSSNRELMKPKIVWLSIWPADSGLSHTLKCYVDQLKIKITIYTLWSRLDFTELFSLL